MSNCLEQSLPKNTLMSLCADEPTITPGSDFSQINVLIPKAKFPEMVDAIKGFDATSIIRNDLKQLIE